MTIAISAFSLTSVVAAETVYLWLISISGVITIIVWMSICVSQFFRKHYVADGGKLEDLKFKTPLYPLVPILGFGLYGIILISLIFIPEQRLESIALYHLSSFATRTITLKLRKELLLTLVVKVKLAKLCNTILIYKRPHIAFTLCAVFYHFNSL